MTSSLWEPIGEFINERLNQGSMPAVHHYTSVRGALGILESGKFWFTERAHLNDPSEISHGIEIATEILKERGRHGDANRFGRCTANVFRDCRFFSGSFTFKDDDLSQWINYGDEGKGVILTLRASAFNNPKKHVDRFVREDLTAVVCPI